MVLRRRSPARGELVFLHRAVVVHVRALAQPSAARYDEAEEEAALRAFWAVHLGIDPNLRFWWPRSKAEFFRSMLRAPHGPRGLSHARKHVPNKQPCY